MKSAKGAKKKEKNGTFFLLKTNKVYHYHQDSNWTAANYKVAQLAVAAPFRL